MGRESFLKKVKAADEFDWKIDFSKLPQKKGPKESDKMEVTKFEKEEGVPFLTWYRSGVFSDKDFETAERLLDKAVKYIMPHVREFSKDIYTNDEEYRELFLHRISPSLIDKFVSILKDVKHYFQDDTRLDDMIMQAEAVKELKAEEDKAELKERKDTMESDFEKMKSKEESRFESLKPKEVEEAFETEEDQKRKDMKEKIRERFLRMKPKDIEEEKSKQPAKPGEFVPRKRITKKTPVSKDMLDNLMSKLDYSSL